MKELAIRLKENDDLRKSIEQICVDHNIDTAIVLCAVGCLKHYKVRLAKAIDYFDSEDDYEIISLTGTISKGNSHIHIGVSNDAGLAYGGHLEYGCIINTTCELVLGILENYQSVRLFDESTGYDEIAFKEVNDD